VGGVRRGDSSYPGSEISSSSRCGEIAEVYRPYGRIKVKISDIKTAMKSAMLRMKTPVMHAAPFFLWGEKLFSSGTTFFFDGFASDL
jgi:hypothetical protein